MLDYFVGSYTDFLMTVVFIPKDIRPSSGAQVGGNYDAGLFIQLADQMERSAPPA